MEPQKPASSGGPGAGDKPAPGFTFADKRKVTPAGDKRSPDPTQEVSEVDGASPVEVEPDVHEQLAAERLVDLQRLQAEYANYRKRVDRDRDVARENAVAAVVESLLPVLDDLYLARQHGDLESGPFVSIAEKLEATLAKYGVERFGEPGTPFDPSVHDALMHVEEELADGTDVTTVVGVLQPGYKIGDRVLRPARVSVADPARS
jgi:molecular chaperone GrpE